MSDSSQEVSVYERREAFANEFKQYQTSDPARAKAAFVAMSAVDQEIRDARPSDVQPEVVTSDYHGEHEAPMHDCGAPLHNLAGVYPDDFYGPQGPRLYAADASLAWPLAMVRALKGRPRAMVTVFRAVPKDVVAKITKGEWVTIDRQYAKQHGDDLLKGNYKIIQKTVRADELFTNGDSLQEWGYDPIALRNELVKINQEPLVDVTSVSAELTIGPDPANPDANEIVTYKGVTATVEVGFEDRGVAILEIYSHNGKTGEARELLSKLKARYGDVVVTSVTEDNPEAIAFWQKMLNEGVVSRARRTDGVELVVDQTTTPAFKNWFGASKVVDSQRQPLVVYHGTKEDFNTFEVGRETENHGTFWTYKERRLAIFFAEDQEFANWFAVQGDKNNPRNNVMSVYLRIEKPLDLSEGFQGLNQIDFNKLKQEFLNDNDWALKIQDDEIWALFDKGTIGSTEFVQALTNAGFDGVKMIERDKNHLARPVWVALSPAQIKSAIGNNGGYSPVNPDIRFSHVEVEAEHELQDTVTTKVDQTETPAFKSWFGTSKMVTVDGQPIVFYHGTTESFDAFEKSRVGGNYPNVSRAFYFSTTPKGAAEYALGHANASYARQPIPGIFKGSPADAGTGGSNIMPVYLRITNPLRKTALGNFSPEQWLDRHREKLFEQARNEGFDGIVIEPSKHFVDRGAVCAVLEPSQIKSAIGNSGHFNPKNPDIRFSQLAVATASNETQDALREVVIENHDKWSIYQEKSAQVGDGFVRWVEDPTMAYVTDIQAGDQQRGTKLLEWLQEATGKSLYAVGVVEDAEEFWGKMEDRGLVEGQSHVPFMEFFGRGLRFSTVAEPVIAHRFDGPDGAPKTNSRVMERADEQALCIQYADPYGDAAPESMKPDFKDACDGLEWHICTIHREGFEAIGLAAHEKLHGLDPDLSDFERPIVFSVGNPDEGEQPWAIWDGVHRVFSAYAKGVDSLPAVVGLAPGVALPSWLELGAAPPTVSRIRFEIAANQAGALRRWFGDSQVVQSNGDPLVLYHGTNDSFDVIDFDASREGEFFFATPDKRVASDFALYRSTWGGANVMPIYVAASRVLEVEGHGRAIRKVELDTRIEGMRYGETVRDFAQRVGYDAIAFRSVRDDVGPNMPPVADVYAILPTARIKSATGNSGAFDRSNPDIRFSQSDQGKQTDAPEFKRWFGDSTAVDAIGNPLVVYHGTPTGGFTVFDATKQGSKGGRARGGFSFTTDRRAAESYAHSFSEEINTIDQFVENANKLWDMAIGRGLSDEAIASVGGDVADRFVEWDWQAYDDLESLRDSADYGAQVLEKEGMGDLAEQMRNAGVKKFVGTPEVKEVYLNVPNGSPVFKATQETLGKVVAGLDVRNIPTRAAIVELEDGHRIFYVADPTQIKSATGNTGAYDSANPDIRFSAVVAQDRPIQSLQAPEFQKWFGKSKVVDVDGKPLVVFHGTDRDFSAFDISKSGKGAAFGPGIYLTEDSSNTNWKRGEGSNVMPVFVAIENPLDIRHPLTQHDADVLRSVGIATAKAGEPAPLFTMEKRFGSIGEAAVAAGFDGLLHYSPNGQRHILAFNPTQIKSAIGNKGTFDSTNPDILFSAVEVESKPVDQVLTPEFAEWFGASKVVDQEGRPGVVYHGTNKEFSQFDATRIGSNLKVDKRGYFFTNVPDVAEYFAAPPDQGFSHEDQWDGAHIKPVYLSLQNPVTLTEVLDRVAMTLDDVHEHYEHVGELYDDVRPEILELVDSKGADGVLLELDGFQQIVVFDPSQIKSAIGNSGAFDRTNPDIRFSVVEAEAERDSPLQTPEFSQWFGASKVVDGEGSPLVVYHGTAVDKDFSEFKGTKLYFSPDPDYASGYADGGMIEGFPKLNSRVMPVYLSIQNPINLEALGETDVPVALLMAHLRAQGVSESATEKLNASLGSAAEPVWNWMHYDAVRTTILEAGFDGAIQRENNGVKSSKVFVAFQPTQIKSAIGNTGAFDRTKPDIRFSMAVEETSPEQPMKKPKFAEWFGASKVVDEEGRPLVMYHGSHRDVTTFDRLISQKWRQASVDTVGSWFSDNPSTDGGAGMYAQGENAAIYPVYLSISNPKYYGAFSELLDAMHRAEGRDPAEQKVKGLGSTEGLRAKLKAEGYDGIVFGRTYNQALFDRISDLQSRVLDAQTAEYSVKRSERPPLTRQREALERQLATFRKRATGITSTEFDKQRVYIAFDPKQIKSAIGNTGAFDRANVDIRFSQVEAVMDTPVTTPEFAAWFDQSKVVNADGTPLRVFHGTSAQFNAFDFATAKDGAHWFTPLESHAASFGPTQDFFVSVQNPMVIDQDALEAAWDVEHPDGEQDGRSLLPRDFVDQFVLQAKAGGYDGLIIRDMGDRDIQSDMYLPFAEGQIKSASANVGSFDPSNPDVRFSSVSATTAYENSPAFQNWFDGSKIMDTGGKPLRVFHGTQASFSQFDEEMQGATVWSEDVGFFFTNDPVEASSYAELDWDKDEPQPNVMPVYLAIKNPMVVTLQNYASPYDNPAIWYDHEGREAAAKAQEEGYDGLIVRDEREDMLLANGVQPTLFVAFKPEQIKSAIGNVGSYDPSKSDIRHSLANAGAPDVRARPAFQQWFGQSKVVDEDGHGLVVFRGEHGDGYGQPQTIVASITFTSDSQVASTYAMSPNDSRNFTHALAPKVIPAYLSIQNPIINNPDDPFVDFSELADKLGDQVAEKFARKFADRIQNTSNWEENFAPEHDSVESLLNATPAALRSLYMDAYPLLDDFAFVSAAKQAGFDGGIHVGNGESMDAVEYRVFSESQVKSALGNNGQFNDRDPDIRASAVRQSPKVAPAMPVKVQPKTATFSRPSVKLGLAGAAGVRDAVVAAFPSLTDSVDRMLQRGKQGKRGGLVVIESDDPYDLALAYAMHTGCDFDVALSTFGVSASTAAGRNAVNVGKPFFDDATAFVDLGHIAQKLGPQAAMAAMREFGDAIKDSSTWAIRYAKKFDDVADAVAAGVPIGDLYFEPEHLLASPHWVQRIEKAGFSVPRAADSSDQIDSMWGVQGSVIKLQGFASQSSGLTFIVAPNVSARSAPAVVLHEVVHSQQRDDLDAKAQELLDSRATQPPSTRAFLERVQARIVKAKQVGNQHETMPYIVEQSVLEGRQEGFSRADGRFLGWVDKAIGPKVGNLVRDFVAFVGATALKFGHIATPSVDELVSLAKMGVQANAFGKTMRGVGVQASQLVDSDVQATGFFFALARGVSAIKARAMTGAMWLDSVRGLVNKGAVKQDEVEWTGLAEWLDMSDGKVTKGQVQEFLRGNGVQVTETVLRDASDEDIATFMDDEAGEGFSRQEAIEYLANDEGSTKYSKYQLPGGTNYRELLLTLPATKRPNHLVARPVGTVGFWEIFNETTQENEGTFATREEAVVEAARGNAAMTGLLVEVGFRTDHWAQINVLAHVRLNDRIDVDDKRVLFVEEVQSDWGQAGRKQGFADTDATKKIAELIKRYDNLTGERRELIKVSARSDDDSATQKMDSRISQIEVDLNVLSNRMADLRSSRDKGVPSAPFVGKTEAWTTLAIKRVIKMAVDEGYDRVAFINGEQAVDRYDLSKQISAIEYEKVDNGNYHLSARDLRGKVVMDESNVTIDRVSTLVGKDMASKISNDEGQEATALYGVFSGGAKLFESPHRADAREYQRTYSGTSEIITLADGVSVNSRMLFGTDLKVGGEGMQAFYDKIIPSVAKDLVRKFGGEGLQEVRVGTGTASPQTGFDITPAMREKVAGGVPLFSTELAQTDVQATGFFSALARGVSSIEARAMTGAMWLDSVRGLVNIGAVKQDEVEWTGLAEWLKLQDGKVTKQQVQEFLHSNGVQVIETSLGDAQHGVSRVNRALLGTGYAADYDNIENEAFFIDPDGDFVSFCDLPSQVQDVINSVSQVHDGAAKFGQYQLPGGTNYREVFLALPETPNGREVADRKVAQLRFEYNKERELYGENSKTATSILAEIGKQKAARDAIPTPKFSKSHWDQVNVLAHIRLNDRLDSDRKRVLFVEEIQSDWAQKGRQNGFNTKRSTPELLVQSLGGGFGSGRFEVYNKSLGRIAADEYGNEAIFDNERDAIAMREQLLKDPYEAAFAVPSAPFVTKTDAWVSLTIKRVIKMAADGGYDRVAFVSGEQSVDRYDLSKHIQSIKYRKEGDIHYIFAWNVKGEMVIDGDKMNQAKIEATFGKDIAQKIAGEAGHPVPRIPGMKGPITRTLEGLDLKAGGEGMKAFYDQIVPNIAKEVVRKLGGGVMQQIRVSVPSKYPKEFATQASAIAWAQSNLGNHEYSVRGFSESSGTFYIHDEFTQESIVAASESPQSGFDITPAMREKVAGGVPLFSKLVINTEDYGLNH